MSLRRVYRVLESTAVRTEDFVGKFPAHILLLTAATMLGVTGYIPATVEPNGFTNACYWMSLLLVLSAMIFWYFDEVVYDHRSGDAS